MVGPVVLLRIFWARLTLDIVTAANMSAVATASVAIEPLLALVDFAWLGRSCATLIFAPPEHAEKDGEGNRVRSPMVPVSSVDRSGNKAFSSPSDRSQIQVQSQ